eukprot:2108467-Prymnesium_polylepis.2
MTEAKAKKDQIIARARTAKASTKVTEGGAREAAREAARGGGEGGGEGGYARTRKAAWTHPHGHPRNGPWDVARDSLPLRSLLQDSSGGNRSPRLGVACMAGPEPSSCPLAPPPPPPTRLGLPPTPTSTLGLTPTPTTLSLALTLTLTFDFTLTLAFTLTGK